MELLDRHPRREMQVWDDFCNVFCWLLLFLILASAFTMPAWVLGGEPVGPANPASPVSPADKPKFLGDRVENREAPPRPVDESRDESRDEPRAVDLRPVVTVFSQNPKNCPPCAAFEKWHASHAGRLDCPFQFVIRKPEQGAGLPGWVKSTPAFHFQDTATKPPGFRVIYGFEEKTGIGPVLAAFEKFNPEFKFNPGSVKQDARPGHSEFPDTGSLETIEANSIPGRGPVSSPAAVTPRDGIDSRSGTDPIAMIRQFTGAKGSFTFTPESPIDATVQPGVTIRYAAISGKYDLTGAQPSVVFDPPTPAGTATTWGWSVGYKILSAVYVPGSGLGSGSDPKSGGELRVKTNWKTIRVKVDFQDSADGDAGDGR